MDSSSGSSQSAWGGFLKKAMEGVEQQLDRVLENPPPKARDAAAAARKENSVSGSPARQSSVGSLGGGRMTLQERLAASIAKSRTGSPVVGSPKKSDEQLLEGMSRSSSSSELARLETNGLGSKDVVPGSPIRTDTPREPLSPDESPVKDVMDVSEAKPLPVRTETPDIAVTPSVDDSPELIQSLELMKPDTPAPPESTVQEPAVQIPPLPPNTDPAIVELISQLRNDLETCESRRIDEAQQSTSRISSLEQKLKILSQSSLEAAQAAASDPSATPLAAKLAEREEKIALLLDEGEKLAKIELNLMTTIKSLRAKQKEDEKTTSTALSRAEKADRQLADTRAQLKRAQDVERKNVERLRGMYKIEAANETLRREQEVANATIGSLRWELAEANARADEAVARVQTEALEEERRVGGELREKLERVQTEMGLVQEQARSEIQELKGRLEREQASSKSLLAEFTAEISTLESKLEVLRSREEESSTSATSSAQAKLLRQIEMLQTQHTIASQNWQRIEGSLQRRNDALEKEKLELLKKLDDEKRKLRDAADAKRTVQSQLDDQKRTIKSLESDLLNTQSQIQSLHYTITTLETRLTDQSSSFTKQKDILTEQFEQTLDARLREEKAKWEEDSQIPGFASPVSAPITPFTQLVSSPGGSRPSRPRNSVSPQPEAMKTRGSFPPSRATSFAELSNLRRPSRHFFDASPSLPPPPLEDEDEREFLSQSRGESPKNTAVDAVSISASTSTAGPSVNIIERMSAAVRRLESDLASSKEELVRSVRQRDEAREECHKLMVEVEEKRRCQDAQRQIQAQLDDLEVRYNEALVLLGEKSERVEELQMDIVDLKEGYQHALQRLVGAK